MLSQNTFEMYTVLVQYLETLLFLMLLKKSFLCYQGCIYLIKNTEK